MAKPSSIQQERARTRIKQMIATRPPGRTKGKEKLRIGKLLGYKGKDSNIIRSVDRIITTDRNSPSARNLRNKEQVKKIDRSFRNRVRNQTITGDDFNEDITRWVKPVIVKSDLKDPKFDVWLPGAIEGIGKKIFGKRRGIIRSYFLSFSGQNVGLETFEGGFNINSTQGLNARYFQGDNPLATTFGYLDNKEDLYRIWNDRIRKLFKTEQYPVTKAIFAPNAEYIELLNDPSSAEKIDSPPQVVLGYFRNVGDLKNE